MHVSLANVLVESWLSTGQVFTELGHDLAQEEDAEEEMERL